MDAAWHLNVMKSHVSAPSVLRDDFMRIASDVRRQASNVYRVRGERTVTSDVAPLRSVWKRSVTRTGVKYSIDRRHHAIRALLCCNCSHTDVLDAVISLLEQTIPIASILQEPPKSLDGIVEDISQEQLDSYLQLVLHTVEFFRKTGKTLLEAREMTLSISPFSNYRDLIEKLLEEATKVENFK